MSLHDGTSELVRSIYDAVDDRAAWHSVLGMILEHTGSHMMLVSAVDCREGNYHDNQWHGGENSRVEDGIREYHAVTYRDDPTLAFGIANPQAGLVRLNRELVRQGRDPADDPYVRWVRNRLGIADSIVRYTPPTNGLILGMSIHASASAGSLDQPSIALFLMLFEHVERAMRIALRPPDFVSEAVNVIMVARDGRIVRASPAAQRLLDGRDGLARTGERLVTASPAHDRRLDAMIRSALGAIRDGGAGAALALPRPSGRPNLLVRVDPLPNPSSPFEAFRPAALIVVTEPDAGGMEPHAARRWAQMFGLSPAEVRLVIALIDEEAGLRPVADRLGIAYATARVQLASVFQKVGVSSQTQLARLLTRIGGWILAILSVVDQAASGVA